MPSWYAMLAPSALVNSGITMSRVLKQTEKALLYPVVPVLSPLGEKKKYPCNLTK